MALKVILLDVDEQVCFDTGIEVGYDFDMLYINTAEDTELVGTQKYHKRQCHRLIVKDMTGKLVIDDADESESLYDIPDGE